ncbi:MAG: GerMN domain-containing protein [Clostridium sp.]|nr:GerMN domain-containing protein [Acetatifactor muris]MCM1526184.1 GerMN domain-containing protein [Bacteroides sp.]MCM1562668.1 GerMN domain-containing protein [Clostridium sp.]
MKKCLRALGCLLLMVGLAACRSEQPSDAKICQIYVVSNSETKVESHAHVMEATGDEAMLEELVECLSVQPDKLEYKAPLAMGFEVLSMNLTDGKLAIDVGESYLNLPATTEVLVRAAVVRTLTQLSCVRYVGITVNGHELFDNAGEVVGLMSADLFIDNDGNEINTYESARVKLYFANSDGDKLIGAYREKYYSTNIPKERFVVEELIAGPSGKVEGLYPSVNPEVKIISVTTQDGVCYVNLDAGFLTVVNNVSTEVSIYAIVNSLAELSNVNRVQILINGEVPASFGSSVFERNLDYVTTLEK